MIIEEIKAVTNDLVKSAKGKARKARGVKRTFCVRCNDEGCSATQHLDFLRGRYDQ